MAQKTAIGLVFEVTFTEGGNPLDISSATVKKIIFQKPGGTDVVQGATFKTDGTDGVLEYVSLTGDIDEAGIWKIQGYVEMTGFLGYSSVEDFHILENLVESIGS